MDGSDEIILSGEYKDFRSGARFVLGGRTPDDVVSALCQINAAVEPHAFKFAGVDVKKIDAMAKKGQGLQAVCAFLKEIKPRALQEELAGAVPRKELLPAAESCLLNRLLANAGVSFMPKPAATLKPTAEAPGDHIAFIAKYGKWVAVKKLGLEKVQDYEVSAVLAGINNTVVNKSFDFAGVKDEAAVQQALAGRGRRSYGNLCAALGAILPKFTGTTNGDAYVLAKVMGGTGYKPYASPEMLTEAHPDIKPPKVKGRKPKG
jgi:hypothetical protein